MANHDFLIENNAGRAVRTDFNNAVAALVSNNSGGTEPTAAFPGMLWFDLSVLPVGLMRQRNLANGSWVAMSGVPPEATNEDVVAGTNDTMFVTPAGLSERIASEPAVVANRLVNPAMQVAQEYVTASSGGAAGVVLTAADQWFGSGATGTNFTVSQVQLRTPRGSRDRIRIVATAAKPALAAGDAMNLWQNVEGLRIADLKFGSAGAKNVIARFGFRGPAGTYTFALRQAANRTYLVPFTISAAQANVDTEQVFVIPGDIAGTWPVNNTLSMQFLVNVACGASYANATVRSWIAGQWLGATGGSNGMAVAGNTFYLFDCGLYEDVSRQGTPPRWQVPGISETLAACQRYFARVYLLWCGLGTSGFLFFQIGTLPVDMRASPTISAVQNNSSGFPTTPGTVVALPNQNGVVRTVREYRTANLTTNAAFFGTDITVIARL